MNTQDKFKAILERLKAPEGASVNDLGPANLSFMVIMDYMNTLNKMGLANGTHGITESGRKFIAVCDEFEWKPTDDEILSFVEEMIKPPERAAFFYFLTQCRDNPTGLAEHVKKVRELGESSET